MRSTDCVPPGWRIERSKVGRRKVKNVRRHFEKRRDGSGLMASADACLGILVSFIFGCIFSGMIVWMTLR